MKLRPIVNLLLTAATASLLGSCAMDDIIQQYTGTEIAFRPSLGMPGARSAEVGIGQLKDTEILVTAIDQHGDTYFKDVVFRNDDPDSPTPLFTSDQKYYWPGDGSPLRFTAYPKSYADRGLIDPNTGVLTYKPMSTWYKDETKTRDGGVILPNGTTVSSTGLITLPDGETIDAEGNFSFVGGTTIHPDYSVDFYDGSTMDTHRNISIKDGPMVNFRGDATFSCGVVLYANGTIKLTDNTIITRDIPNTYSDGTIVHADGSLTLPDGTFLKPVQTETNYKGETLYLYPLDKNGTLLRNDATIILANGMLVSSDGSISWGNHGDFWPYFDELFISNSLADIYFNDRIDFYDDNDDVIYSINLADLRVTGMPEPSPLQPHEDIVVAHATGSKDNIAGLPLVFGHKLSQVEVYATNGNPSYIYEIVNVKLANIQGAGSLALNNNATWQLDPDFKQNYTTEYDYQLRYFTNKKNVREPRPIVLEKGVVTTITDPNPHYMSDVVGEYTGSLYGAMMVLPQTFVPWDKTTSNPTGAYLAVKLRIKTYKVGGWVYPEMGPDSDPDKQPYGWVAIPLSGKWEAGKRYVYTLDFSNGAGYSDPEEPNPHPILTEEIKYTLDVFDWSSGSPSVSYPIE